MSAEPLANFSASIPETPSAGQSLFWSFFHLDLLNQLGVLVREQLEKLHPNLVFHDVERLWLAGSIRLLLDENSNDRPTDLGKLTLDDPGINLPLLIDEQLDESRAVRIRRWLPVRREASELWGFDDEPRWTTWPCEVRNVIVTSLEMGIDVRVDLDDEPALPVILGLSRLNDNLFWKPVVRL